jgi:hypothetical protein
MYPPEAKHVQPTGQSDDVEQGVTHLPAQRSPLPSQDDETQTKGVTQSLVLLAVQESP